MAELEDSHPWTRAMRALTFAWLERAGAPVAARVLDVGCGTGLFLTQWTRRWRISNAYGIDLFPEALRYATHRTRAHWCAASAAAPPFGSGLFDAIHCADVLQHLSLSETERAFDFFAAG